MRLHIGSADHGSHELRARLEPGSGAEPSASAGVQRTVEAVQLECFRPLIPNQTQEETPAQITQHPYPSFLESTVGDALKEPNKGIGCNWMLMGLSNYL